MLGSSLYFILANARQLYSAKVGITLVYFLWADKKTDASSGIIITKTEIGMEMEGLVWDLMSSAKVKSKMAFVFPSHHISLRSLQ